MTDSLDFPEDPRRLAAWLEEWLADLDRLPELVIILAKGARRLPRDRSANRALRSILGPDDLQAVGERGLAVLADRPVLLHQLLEEPELLLELQEWIFTAGGPYWVAGPPDTPSTRARIRRSLAAGMAKLRQAMEEGSPGRVAPSGPDGGDREKSPVPPRDAS